MKQRQWVQGAAAVLLFACCSLAQAQWVWVNDKGIRQYSDQPPPAATPPSRILKAPRGHMPDLRKEMAEQPADETQRPAVPPKDKPSVAERNADYEKRRAESLEQKRKAEMEARNKADSATACENARANQRMLESGIRIATADKDGERAFLDDKQKAEQLRRSRDTIATHCR